MHLVFQSSPTRSRANGLARLTISILRRPKSTPLFYLIMLCHPIMHARGYQLPGTLMILSHADAVHVPSDCVSSLSLVTSRFRQWGAPVQPCLLLTRSIYLLDTTSPFQKCHSCASYPHKMLLCLDKTLIVTLELGVMDKMATHSGRLRK